MRLITKVVVAVLISTLVCSGTLLLTYYIKYKSVAFYRVMLGTIDIGDRENIIFIILPSLFISAVVNLLVAICIGLYASRKYALPIYKLEQWAEFLKSGKMTAKLKFREKEEFKDLSDNCNEVTELFRGKFVSIKKQIDSLPKDQHDSPPIQAVSQTLSTLNLDADTIHVHTGLFRAAEEKKTSS